MLREFGKRGSGPDLYLTSDPDETSIVADRHPAVLTELRETLIRRAGGRPPYYGT